MSAKRRFWLVGGVVAGIGVVLARVVAERYGEPLVKLAIFGVGTLLAFAGLGVIMYAIKKTPK